MMAGNGNIMEFSQSMEIHEHSMEQGTSENPLAKISTHFHHNLTGSQSQYYDLLCIHSAIYVTFVYRCVVITKPNVNNPFLIICGVSDSQLLHWE